ncbi:MAG: hypothetical protein R2911_34930 [Caldilineaceae bacterium]
MEIEQISVEMAMGHVLQNLVKQEEMLHAININLAKSDLHVGNPIPLDKPPSNLKDEHILNLSSSPYKLLHMDILSNCLNQIEQAIWESR